MRYLMTWTSGPYRCEVRVDEASATHVGRVQRGDELVAHLAGDTLAKLRAAFEAWLKE